VSQKTGHLMFHYLLLWQMRTDFLIPSLENSWRKILWSLEATNMARWLL